MIKEAVERSFSWFGLHPSRGHEGVTRLKENRGAEPLACPVMDAGRPATSGGRVVADIVHRLRGFEDEGLSAPVKRPTR